MKQVTPIIGFNQTPEDSLSMRACLKDFIPATIKIEPIISRVNNEVIVRLESGTPIATIIAIGMITIRSARTIDACMR